MRTFLVHAGTLLLYLALTLGFAHPIALCFSSGVVLYQGNGGMDLAPSLWNLWHFRQALSLPGGNPLWTDYMFWPYGANLLLNESSLFYAFLAGYLTPLIGLVATYNLHTVAACVLAGYAVFLMCRDWGRSWSAAFLAGCIFTFSPTFDYHVGHNLDYSPIYPIALFLWALCRAIRGRSLLAAAMAALAMTLQWTYGYYYFMFFGVIIPFFYVCMERPFSLGLSLRTRTPALLAVSRLLELALLAAFLRVLFALGRGQIEFHGQGSFHTLLRYVAPYLVFWALLGLRLAARYRLHGKLNFKAFAPEAIFPYAATIACWIAFNAPLLVTVGWMMATGDSAGPARSWGGGGNPADILWLFLPNPYHRIWGKAMAGLFLALRLGPQPLSYLGLTPVAAAYWLWRKRPRDRWVSLWFMGAAFSFIMTLGPWVKIMGIHTYLPLPFYFLHLLPIFNNIRTGFHFAMFTMFFLAMIFAVFLDQIRLQMGPRRARWVFPLAFCLLTLEFFPSPRWLYSMETSALLKRLADRPYGAMLTLPVGANFDGLDANSHMGMMLFDNAAQIIHQKPLVGGYLGRPARRTHQAMIKDPFFQSILAAQSGAKPAPLIMDGARMARYFREIHVSYVLVDSHKTPPSLLAAVGRWPLARIDREGTLELYSVRGKSP